MIKYILKLKIKFKFAFKSLKINLFKLIYMSFFQFGKDSIKISFTFHKNNRTTICDILGKDAELAKLSKEEQNCVVIMTGGKETQVYDTDTKFDD